MNKPKPHVHVITPERPGWVEAGSLSDLYDDGQREAEQLRERHEQEFRELQARIALDAELRWTALFTACGEAPDSHKRGWALNAELREHGLMILGECGTGQKSDVPPIAVH